MWSDIRAALRTFRHQPVFAVTAAVTLALGIGANVALFSVVNGVLLQPLPYPRPEQLVRVYEEHPGGQSPLGMQWISDVTLDAWRSGKTLRDIAVFSSYIETVGRNEPERWASGVVSPSLFALLHVTPAAGRFFDDREAAEGQDGVVVLSHDVWRERYGASAEALGQTLWVDGKAYQIVGVAPPGFGFPAADLKFWRPYVLPSRTDAAGQQRIRVMQAIARLADGVTAAQASAEGTAAARSVTRPRSANMMFGDGGPVVVHVVGFVEAMTRSIRPALLVLSVGVGLVLLVACANVANLFLSRGVVRQRELAVRAALGAGRSRLLRQLLTESALVAVAGGTLGVLLAAWFVRLLPVVAGESIPRIANVRVDAVTMTFAFAASFAAALLAGGLPAIRGARTGLTAAMGNGGARTTGSAARTLRRGLLVVEAALAVVLLVGAALLVRSFATLMSVDAGFNAENVLTAQVLLPPAPGERPNSAMADALLSRVRALPGVLVAGVGNMAPLEGTSAIRMMTLSERTAAGEPIQARAIAWAVTAGYAEALGLRLKQGRFFTAADASAASRLIVVNEEFVRLYWSDGKAVVGRQYDGVFAEKGNLTEVIGVVANTLKDGLERKPEPEVYSLAQTNRLPSFGRTMFLALRADRDPTVLVSDLRRVVLDLERRAALDRVGTLTNKVAESLAEPRFSTVVLAGFAALAVLLSAVGLYGVLSYGVSERRREIGVRSAMGATRGQLIGLVVREGLAVVLVGLAIGLGVAALLGRFMQSVLFGVTALDPWVYAVVPVLLVLVAFVACIVPARRAASIDPVEALRTE